MSEFAPTIVDNDAPARRPGPGGRLQAARLERQLEVAAVALALHVVPRVVEALEEDRFGEFDAPVYARGYLRSYARFLNLPVDEVLAAYDEIAGDQPLPSLLPPANARPLPRDYSALRKAGLLVLALLLVGASYWWWMGRVAPPATPVVAPSAASGTPATAAAEPAAVTDGDSPGNLIMPAPESVSLGGTSEAAPGVSTANTAPAAAQTSAPAPAPVVPVAAKPAPVAAAPVAAPAVKTPPTTPPVPAPATAAAPAGPKAVPLAGQPPPPLVASVPDGPQIVLRGKKDCWVEVRAAGGARLFYGLVRPGETHTMPGPAPWFVFLGYADGIEVSVGGHLIEVPAARREGAKARFGLAADGTLR